MSAPYASVSTSNPSTAYLPPLSSPSSYSQPITFHPTLTAATARLLPADAPLTPTGTATAANGVEAQDWHAVTQRPGNQTQLRPYTPSNQRVGWMVGAPTCGTSLWDRESVAVGDAYSAARIEQKRRTNPLLDPHYRPNSDAVGLGYGRKHARHFNYLSHWVSSTPEHVLLAQEQQQQPQSHTSPSSLSTTLPSPSSSAAAAASASQSARALTQQQQEKRAAEEAAVEAALLAASRTSAGAFKPQSLLAAPGEYRAKGNRHMQTEANAMGYGHTHQAYYRYISVMRSDDVLPSYGGSKEKCLKFYKGNFQWRNE